MATGFTIGGSGGGGKKARALPNGTKVRIADADVKKSNFPRTIQKGPRAGEKVDKYEVLIVYEAMESGKTKPYKTKKGVVPAEDFAPGDRFDQYLGGVYLKDENDPNGDINITEAGGAYAFVERMELAGVEPTGDFADYIGAVVTIEQEPTSGPAGRGSRAMPAEVLEEPTGPVDTKAAKVKRDAEALAKKHAAARAAESDDDEEESEDDAGDAGDAWSALGEDDREAINDAVEAGLDSPSDLVDMGFADDEEHAEAILAAMPGAKPKAKKTPAKAKPAAKKAAKKPAKKTAAKKTKGK